MKLWLLFELASLAALGVAQGGSPISTDRPDFTESALVVPFRSVQLETGLTYQWARGTYGLSGPEALFRIGYQKQTELRIGIPDFNISRDNGRWRHGFGDVYLATKIQLGPLRNGDDLAVIPGINLPSQNADFSTGTVDPELKLCWGRNLGANWGVSAMAYALYTSDDWGRFFQFQQTISFDHELSQQLAMFVEYSCAFSLRGIPEHIVHTGLLFATGDNTQFDIHGGWALDGSDRKPFLAAGYSIRR